MSFKDLTTKAAELLKSKSPGPSGKEPEIKKSDDGSKGAEKGSKGS